MCPIVVSLKSVRFVVSAALLAAGLMTFAPAAALAQATFHGVGDLPGGSFHSEIRDATKHNGVIYAVGGGNGQVSGCNDPCGIVDTAILWRWDGTSGSLTALPNLVVNTTAASVVTASAITPDGAYIASRARSATASGPGSGPINNQRQAVRVTTALVPFPSANLNLAAFTPALNPSTAAATISADGSILYGFRGSDGTALRFDTVGGTSAVIPIPWGFGQILPAARAESADGSVMVGSANNFDFYSGQAFRYVHGSGVSGIPLLAGGNWNGAVALSPDGNLVLVAGNSPAYPNGEVYLHNATNSASTPLGSPNSAWSPSNVAGMTPDGSVVAVSFYGPNRGFAYFRNSHGWFLVASALGAQGIDVKAAGWTELGLMGMSSDGALVFGSGVHNGQVEGWVAEFPAGYLADFNPQPVAPSNTSMVGAWHVNDTGSGSPAVVVFMADGTYYLINSTVTTTEVNAAPGFERGLYTWDAASGAFTVTTLNDTNGDAGLSDNNGVLNATVFVSGDTLSLGGTPIGTRIVAPAGTPLKDSLVGAWVVGNSASVDGSFVAVFDSDGTYYQAQDGPNDGGSGYDGIEQGTYAWDSGTQVLAATSIAVDTNGDWGLSDPFGNIRFQPYVDGLTAQVGDDSGLMPAYRVIVLSVATPAGLNVTVEPQVPSGAPPVTITFEAVSGGGGTTSLAIIPPSSAPTLSPNFSVGDPATYYEISAPAFSGQATLCFNYAGINFGGNTPRLLHYEGGVWKDITTSVDAATTTVCGVTASFSPFTIAGSPTPFYTRTGFYSPVNMVPGFVNTAKGGSTIPLKFNVYVNGVEKKDTAGLQFAVLPVACATLVAEDQVDWVTSDATSLRYDGQQFHQNWKTPKGTGCYIARVTTADGKALTANFKLK